MEGEEYLSINPDTFSDHDQWSYRDLQKLCMKLNLGGRGTRGELEDKLMCWHRVRNEESKTIVECRSEFEESLEMNVIGNNFAVLAVSVKGTSKSRRRRSSIIAFEGHNTVGVVSPTKLRPLGLGCDPKMTFTGILKKKSKYSPKQQHQSFSCSKVYEVRGDQPQTASAVKRLGKIAFSPFNGVKIIPHRLSIFHENENEKNPSPFRRLFSDDDDDGRFMETL